jgi:SAM-dependent methyltransferase
VDFQRLYEYRFRDVDQDARAAVWEPIARFLYEQLDRPAKVLDPAAGRCEFLNALPSEERWGVDMADYEEAHARSDTHMVIANVMDAELPQSHFDAVFVSNFLEHLPSPEAVYSFLAKMRDCLRPGGKIAVMGPNIRYCADEYWDCADHELGLTHVAIEEHLYTAGLQPLRTYPRFLPYSFRGILPPSPRLTAAYLRTRPAWRFLGKQFLVTAER